MKKISKKFAFTLAEVMITLIAIGVLTAILLPTMWKSRPDENALKFKKGNSTLFTVIQEMTASDKYYLDGNLGIDSNGSDVSSHEYFCETFSDLLSIKNQNCSYQENSGGDFLEYDSSSPLSIKNEADSICKRKAPVSLNRITANDDVVYYEPNNMATFATLNNSGLKDSHGFLINYKVFCMDVDGIPDNATADECVNLCPFGYAIRADGKIITGTNADTWITKEIQTKD